MISISVAWEIWAKKAIIDLGFLICRDFGPKFPSQQVEEEYMYWCEQVGQDPLPPGGRDHLLSLQRRKWLWVKIQARKNMKNKKLWFPLGISFLTHFVMFRSFGRLCMCSCLGALDASRRCSATGGRQPALRGRLASRPAGCRCQGECVDLSWAHVLSFTVQKQIQDTVHRCELFWRNGRVTWRSLSCRSLPSSMCNSTDSAHQPATSWFSQEPEKSLAGRHGP